MRISYVLCFLMAAFSVPAAAAGQDLRQEVEKIGAAYAEKGGCCDAAVNSPVTFVVKLKAH